MSATEFDVVVIGGGLAGMAVLRDLARRGASAMLFERGDLVSRGSMAAHGTIDTLDLELDRGLDASTRRAREAEAAILVTSAPHLARLVPVIALSSGERRGRALLARWDATLALRARRGEPIDREALDARAAREREPGLSIDDERGAIVTRRLRLDAHRLGLAFARDAIEHGAELRLHDEVVSITHEGKSARVKTATSEVTARAVVLATGAFAIPGTSPPPAERRVHLVIEHSLTTHAIVQHDASIVPFHNVTIVSSAAAPFDGAVDDTRVSRTEVRALLASLGRVLPDLRPARVDAAYASVRRIASASDPLAMPHGSPWSARARAEQLGKKIALELGLSAESGTTTAKVPGGEEVVDSFAFAERLTIPEASARRLALRHGARAIDLGARIAKRRIEASVVCACEPVMEAEIRHAVHLEHARDVCDVGRRTGLGHGPCGGMRCAHRAAEIVRIERALPASEAHTMTRRFLAERWVARAPALDATTLAQEELAHARWASSDPGRFGTDQEPKNG